MRVSVDGRRIFKVAGVALIVMALTATSARSISPPPPDGPPAPLLIGIAVSGPAVVNEGASAQYDCIGNYSDGTSAALAVSWDVDSASATINASGLLSAGNVSADQNTIVTATYGGFISTLEITIKYVAPVLTGITITGPTVVNEGTKAQYSCTANYSDGTTAPAPTAVWSENSSYASIAASGLLSAVDVSSDQSVTITASYGGKSDTHSATIKFVAPLLTSITISGPSAIDEETSAQYVCTATYSDGSSGVVAPSWSENSSATTISGSGALTAGNIAADKNITITASYGGKSDTHSVTIKYVAPTLESIAISGLTQVNEESSAQYVCTATYSDGTSQVVVPSWGENSSFATINASGYLLAGDVTVDQSVTITASYGGKSDTHTVTINYVAPPITLTSLSISGSDSAEENTTAQFICTALYSDGSSAVVTPVWSENSASATISTSGLLSAGNIESDESLTITASFGGKVAFHSVEIWVVGTRVFFPLSGFGTIKADLWDETAQEWREEFGATDAPSELVVTSMEPGHWYRLRIYEYADDSGLWVLVYTNWVSM